MTRGNMPTRSPNPGLEQLLPSVYEELRRVAEAALRCERTGHTLQPTALVHEVYLRLADRRNGWESRAQVIAAGAVAIRRILVDHARERARVKRGGGRAREVLSEIAISTCDGTLDLLALDEALEALGALWPERARTIELRFFGGLSIQETAGVMGISTATVEREWRFARAWLFRRLRPQNGTSGR